MNRGGADRRRAVVLAVLLPFVGSWAAFASDHPEPGSMVEVQETYAAASAIVDLHFDLDALRDLAVSLEGSTVALDGTVSLDLIDNHPRFHLLTDNGELRAILGGEMPVGGGTFRLQTADGEGLTIDGLDIVYDPDPEASYELFATGEVLAGRPLFNFSGLNIEFQPDDGSFIVDADVRISVGLADALGLHDGAGRIVGDLLLNSRMVLSQSVLADQGGVAGSAVMYPVPAGSQTGEGFVPNPGPDVIISSLFNMAQSGRVGAFGSGTVGLSVGTTSCNIGDTPLHWFVFPSTDHPMIPQNLYRLRTVDQTDRFEQIGQGWMKHAFLSVNDNFCSPPLGCVNPLTGTLLGVGCSDPYSTSLNATQCLLGPRAAVNPYTGFLSNGDLAEPDLGPGGGCTSNFPSRNHLGHQHDIHGIAHRVQVQDVDLIPSLNPGARYFSEAAYITRHEFDEGNGNQLNNVSYQETSVTVDEANGEFMFFRVGSTVQEQPAVSAWPGASETQIEPDPGNDGIAILAYKVTDLGDNLWHYEYALYNMNLDRSIWQFRVPIPAGVEISNTGFHAPLNHAPELNTDTFSNVPWSVDIGPDAVTWSTTSYIVNPFANAIRFGTLYNFRFDADSPPIDVDATVGLFKTGEFVSVATQGPATLDPPEIVHGSSGVSFDSQAFSGYIDPRMESSNGVDRDWGVSVITLHFSQRVEALGGGPLAKDSFLVRQTGSDPPPEIDGVSASGNPTIRISLTRIISLQEWTTIEAKVQNVAGIPIPNLGDLGAGVPEPDRIDIGFLPGDIDQNGTVESLDLIRFRQFIDGSQQPDSGMDADFVDTNRDGIITPQDLIRFRQLLSGSGDATQVWQLMSMNHPQP